MPSSASATRRPRTTARPAKREREHAHARSRRSARGPVPPCRPTAAGDEAADADADREARGHRRDADVVERHRRGRQARSRAGAARRGTRSRRCRRTVWSSVRSRGEPARPLAEARRGDRARCAAAAAGAADAPDGEARGQPRGGHREEHGADLARARRASAPSSSGPAAPPRMIARNVVICSAPLPRDSCASLSRSGTMPYLAGLKKAAWMPISSRTPRGIRAAAAAGPRSPAP